MDFSRRAFVRTNRIMLRKHLGRGANTVGWRKASGRRQVGGALEL